MASITDIRLALAEQVAVRFRLVNRMARRANDISLRMIAAPYVRAVLVFRMASQTRIQSLVRCHLRKCANGVLAAFRVHVFFARTVATFASGFVDGRVRQDTRLVVGISEKLERHIRMTGTAGVTAGISIAGRNRFRPRRLCRQFMGA